ncbi:hypothetical protein G7Y89_g5506 [Cudoniella acicularis]|uniref:DUF1996 domain-containing protein n=1 Tax=Cudoniella acicularis TaxID=354080 RepID=A0A8H4RNR7_9HELO|nr:hypothetical protein G7Y89_g5506 [Cudoniella acicularis]
MDPATEPPSRSTCTSCTFLDDFSNYWTAVMYFQARNGTFMRAKQLGSLFHEAANGGITIYYFDAPGGYNITAFQKGFRMRNGDPTVRDKESASRFKGITYTCLARPDTRYTNVTSEELWPEDESQPFLWSFGDRTGYGHHGDYIFGWKGGSLQRAFDAKCKPILNCAKLPTQEISVANTCTKNRTVAEEVDGWLDELPGGVEVLG